MASTTFRLFVGAPRGVGKRGRARRGMVCQILRAKSNWSVTTRIGHAAGGGTAGAPARRPQEH
eukprot:10000846-Lingulodinium_polyedra.AAC.1